MNGQRGIMFHIIFHCFINFRWPVFSRMVKCTTVLHWHTAGVQQEELISERGKVQKGNSLKRIGKSEVDTS